MTKTTDPHKESRAKTEEKGKDNENLQDMCKNHQDSVTYTWRAYNRKKKEFATYIICGLQYLLLIFARYDKKT